MPDIADPKMLRELLNYDPETGLFTWRERAGWRFLNQGQCDAWNARWAGQPALCSAHPTGYLSGRIFGRLYYAHRVAFAYCYGRWPRQQIDHIDQSLTNNRIANLRDVGKSENMRNGWLQRRNKSGCPGVQFKANRWQATITLHGVVHYLGRFKDIAEAISARKAKEAELGFSPLHGRPR